ncbi:hypothetical protein WICPIJ_009446 [Wickerhamomyces pijperi]|uniref:Uncharacterized protein n=1 Tax=Wickerhamomyces pijperi TaxID=599730 RepID=A0A9P8PMQ9_WICPI|nr:hypothetical protein WICPIJ_009446 [Wickerhamomyces pijperi]
MRDFTFHICNLSITSLRLDIKVQCVVNVSPGDGSGKQWELGFLDIGEFQSVLFHLGLIVVNHSEPELGIVIAHLIGQLTVKTMVVENDFEIEWVGMGWRVRSDS